ncbi:TPA: gas vesicle protein [Methanosarcinaceae archaeon]|nr:gas vesicle protein [Methanosarcinaceae archaeon]
MLPQRDTCTLVDLLDRLLEKGLVLRADLVITVAGVPLIGLNLVATLAEMETMLKYGIFEGLDKTTREWALEHKQGIPFLEGEKPLDKAYGSYRFDRGKKTAWKYGYIYVTDHRIFAWDKGLRCFLFEFRPEEIKAVKVEKRLYEKKERDELCFLFQDETSLFLHVEKIRDFKKSIEMVSSSSEV